MRAVVYSPLSDVLTVAEVAAVFDKSPRTVRRACDEGKLLARSSSGGWLIDVASAHHRWYKTIRVGVLNHIRGVE